jgi:hypothetical protein
MTAGTLLQSIAAKASEYGDRELTVPEKNKLTSTHLRASGLVRTALGEARRMEERTGNITMPTEKDIEFVKFLFESTKKGSMQWQPTAEQNVFTTSLQGRYRVFVSAPGAYPKLELLKDRDGRVIRPVPGVLCGCVGARSSSLGR